MMSKITFAETSILLGYQKKHLLEKLFCNHYLYDIDNLSVKVVAKIKWYVYIALFIPMCIYEALWCIWDTGLKHFEIEDSFLYDYVVSKDSQRYRNWVETEIK